MSTYYIVKISDNSYSYAGTVSSKPAVPPPDFHCIYIAAEDSVNVPEDGMIWHSVDRRFVFPSSGLKLSKTQLLERIGTDIAKNILIASQTDPDIALLLQFVQTAEYIDLEYPTTISNIEMLVSKAILTEEQKNTLLSGGSL